MKIPPDLQVLIHFAAILLGTFTFTFLPRCFNLKFSDDVILSLKRHFKIEEYFVLESNAIQRFNNASSIIKGTNLCEIHMGRKSDMK